MMWPCSCPIVDHTWPCAQARIRSHIQLQRICSPPRAAVDVRARLLRLGHAWPAAPAACPRAARRWACAKTAQQYEDLQEPHAAQSMSRGMLLRTHARRPPPPPRFAKNEALRRMAPWEVCRCPLSLRTRILRPARHRNAVQDAALSILCEQWKLHARCEVQTRARPGGAAVGRASESPKEFPRVRLDERSCLGQKRIELLVKYFCADGAS